MTQTRQDILKGLSLGVGGSLLTPFLNQVQLQAEGKKDQIPTRFVFVVKSSGIWASGLTPEKFINKTKCNESLGGVTLPDSMKPLEPFKDQMSVIQGLSGKMCRGGHTSMFGAMGVWMTVGENYAGPIIRATADAELAKLFPAPFNHVGLAVREGWGNKAWGGTMYPGITATGQGKELPFYGSPDMAYEQLFGSAAAGVGGDAAKRFMIQRNLLDFMVDDIKKVKKSIPSTETGKMDAYLNAFEELQVRHSRLTEMKGEIKDSAPGVNDTYTSVYDEDRQEAHFGIASAALIAGLTNVVTIRLDNTTTVYKKLGIDKHTHGIGHNEGTKPQGEYRDIIRKYHCELLADMARKLSSVPEGDGTMLDNTMIMYLSDSGDLHHGQLKEWPYLLIGGCGGKLKIQGRYIRYPEYGQKGCRTIGNWWTTLLNAYGNNIEHFGNEDLVLKQNGASHRGPLEDLIV